MNKAVLDSDLYAEIPVLRARMQVPAEEVDAILEETYFLENPPGAYQNLLTGEAWIEAFGIEKEKVEATAVSMLEAARACGVENPEICYETLPREDWAEAWKKFFSVLHISPRVTVRPPWEEYSPQRDDEIVVVIEPGMSFGTGLHGTTQACLRFLEDRAQCENAASLATRSVADFGCGSGILSIAARKLGFGSVTGLDYDAAAVRISAENAADNDTPDIRFEACDVTCDPLPSCDIVLANILAPILIRSASRIAASVTRTPQSALILSGILTEQYPEVCAAYRAQGFSEVRSITIAEWTSGLFQRNEP